MYKVCIFDLDGTLTDTLDSLTVSVNKMLEVLGLGQITQDQCRSFVGNGAKVLVGRALRACGDDDLAHLEEGYKVYGRIFDEYCTLGVRPYRGIPELLETLHEKRIKTAVLSNKPDRQAIRVVEECFGGGTFDWVQGQRESVPRKPDPTAALEIARRLGADPSETLYVGDSEVDLKTGQAAGMRTVVVSWGFRSRRELADAGADRIADSAEEILEMIKEEENHGRIQ